MSLISFENAYTNQTKKTLIHLAAYEQVTNRPIRAFHVLFVTQTLHETQNYQYLKLDGLVQFKPDQF